MDPKDPNFDPNKQEDDNKSDKDEPMPEEYRGQVELLDLSDDVLLCILRLCSPRDLKALGHTCPRLGALICDRTLWMRVDAREQPTGLERMRWFLDHCLSSVTQELHVRGYVDRESRCLGIQDLTWQNNDAGGAGVDDHCLLRMWYPYLPRYAMSPRWPDKREVAGKAYSRDKRNNSRAPLLSHLASQIVANPGPSGNNNANNSNNGASCSNDNASNSNNKASDSNNIALDYNNGASCSNIGASCSKKEASDSNNMESDLNNEASTLNNKGSNSDNMASNSSGAFSGNVASNSGTLASNIDNEISSANSASDLNLSVNSDPSAISSAEINSVNLKSDSDSNLNGFYKNSGDTSSINNVSNMDADNTHSDIALNVGKSDLNAKFLNPNKVKLNMVASKAKPLISNALVSRQNKLALSQNKAVASQNNAAARPNKIAACQNNAALRQNRAVPRENTPGSSQNKAVSNQNKAAASQNRAVPRQNTSGLSQNKAVSSQNKAAASQNRAVPRQNTPGSSQNKAVSSQNKAAASQNRAVPRQNTPGSSQNKVVSGQNKSDSSQNTAGSSQKAVLKNKNDSLQHKDGPARKIKKIRTRNVGTNTGKTMYRLNRGLYRRLNAGRPHVGRPYGLPRYPVARNAPNFMAPNFAPPNLLDPNLWAPNLAAPYLVAPNLVPRNLAAPNLVAPNLAAPDLLVPNLVGPNANAPAENSNEPASNANEAASNSNETARDSNKPAPSASTSDTNSGTSNSVASNASTSKSEPNLDKAPNVKMEKNIDARGNNEPMAEMASMPDSPIDKIANGEEKPNLGLEENPENRKVIVVNGEGPNAEALNADAPNQEGAPRNAAQNPPPGNPRNDNEILRGMIRRRRLNVPRGDFPEIVPGFPGNLPDWGYPGMRERSNEDNLRSKEAKEVMDAIIANCPGPQFTLDHAVIRNLRSKCYNLTSLSLEYCNLDYRATNLRHFPPKLKKLSLKGTRCYNLPLNSSLLGKIQDRLPALEYLDISECEWFEPASLMSLSKLPNLEQLFMKDCKRLTECVAYASLATRYGFQKLKVLDVRGSLVADSEVSAFGWLPLLEELYVSPPEDTRSFTEHSHKWEDELAPFNELDQWEAEEPDYYKCKAPNSPQFMDEDEDAGEEKLGDMIPDNYVECASLESRIIVIHPNRNQNERGYEVLRPEAVRPADIDPQPQEQQQQQDLPEPSNEDEIAALEAESLEPEIPSNKKSGFLEKSPVLQQSTKHEPSDASKTPDKQPPSDDEVLPGPSNECLNLPLNDLPGPSKDVQNGTSNNLPEPLNEDLPQPVAEQREAIDNAQPGPSLALQNVLPLGLQDLDSSEPSSSDSSHDHVDCDPESECHDKFKPGSSKRPHENDQDKSKRLRLDKETSTTQDRQEQRARINAIRNNMARNNPNAYVRIRNGMPIIVPPNPDHLRPLRALAFEIWRARDRNGPPILFPVDDNNDVQDPGNNQAQDGGPVQENQPQPNIHNNVANDNIQANGQPNENPNNNDQANNENPVIGDGQNNEVRQNIEQRPIWERLRGFHRRRLFPGYHRIAAARPVHPGQVGRDPVQGPQPDGNDRPNGEQPNGNRPERQNWEGIRGFHRRRFIPALIRQHGFRRILQRNAEQAANGQPNENGPPNGDRPHVPPVWQRLRGIQRRGLIPAIIAGRPLPVGPPIFVNQHHEPGEENPQENGDHFNHEPQFEIQPIVNRFHRFQRGPVAVQREEGVHDGNPAQGNPEPANDGGNAEPNAPINDPQPNIEIRPIYERFHRFRRINNPAGPGEQAPEQQEANAEQVNAERPNEGANRRDYRRRMIPALVQDGNVPIVHLDLEAPPRNMPHGFPLFGWYLVTDSAVLRFGRADNEHYIPIGDFQPNERGVRPDRSNLRVLSITGFRNITNRSLEHLATAAPYLRRIDFSQTSVTAQGVEIFRAIRPDCEVIFSEFQRM